MRYPKTRIKLSERIYKILGSDFGNYSKTKEIMKIISYNYRRRVR